METICLQNRLLSASVGMGRLIPRETLLEISVKCPSVLPHEMPSVLFNIGEQSPLLGTGSGRLSIRLIWQTDYRQLRNHKLHSDRGHTERSGEFKLGWLLDKVLQDEVLDAFLNVMPMHIGEFKTASKAFSLCRVIEPEKESNRTEQPCRMDLLTN